MPGEAGTDHEQVERLAQEQAALRRVATLVARAMPAERVFAAVAEEVAGVVPGADYAVVARYELGGDESAGAGSGDGRAGHAVVVGGWSSAGAPVPVGTGSRLTGPTVTRVLETGQPAWTAGYAGVPDRVAARARALGVGSAAGAPISVEGRVWGLVLVVSTGPAPLPPNTEGRLAEFTDLVATAIANTQARMELHTLADEQAALRRVATLVARGEPPGTVFAAVAEEVGRLLPADITLIGRYQGDATATLVAAWSGGAHSIPVGDRFPLGGQNVTTMVRDTGRPARLDSYRDAAGAPAEAARTWGIGSSVGAPISVAGRIWGVMVVGATHDVPWPAGTEARLAGFTDLVATAIANADAREELNALAAEQAALRRVATLVARGEPRRAVFVAVAQEAGRVVPADAAVLSRYDPDGYVTAVGGWSAGAGVMPAGERLRLGGRNISTLVFETGRAARIDRYGDDAYTIDPAKAHWVAAAGWQSAVGVPISVAGHAWGVMLVGSAREDGLPPGTEARLAGFTELVATAIANAEAHAELTASRARIVATADDTRRRIERDLHDGAQQRLVSLALEVRAAQMAVPPQIDGLAAQLDGVATGLTAALDELREYARGIHPAILAEGGLGPALQMVARRCPAPVELDVGTSARLPERVEVTVYYVVSEMLANAAKHAKASVVRVAVHAADGVVRVSVGDDGVGGADPRRGSGLVGLTDRVEAIGGTLTVLSPPGCGTRLAVELPLDPG